MTLWRRCLFSLSGTLLLWVLFVFLGACCVRACLGWCLNSWLPVDAGMCVQRMTCIVSSLLGFMAFYILGSWFVGRYRERTVMDCPVCGYNVGGVAFLVSIVRVATFNCPCGRHWRVNTFVGNPSPNELVAALESLRSRYPGAKTDLVRHVVLFLQRKIDSAAANAPGKARATRAKAADLWERKFLLEAAGDDI